MADEIVAPVEQKASEATKPVASAPASDPAPAADAKMDDAPAAHPQADDKPATTQEPTTSTTDKPSAAAEVEPKDVKPAAEKSEDSKSEVQSEPRKAGEDETAESKSAETAPDATTQAESAIVEADATPSGKGRRKSGVSEHKGKKLNKKASKAKIVHLDAQPGDHFFARLKGFPPWPVVVCDEDMLPQTMIATRPVSAARDGVYREDYADGGKRAADRTYPVMYLHTNEFSWTRNTDLEDLDPTVVKDLITPKMRKDLAQAHVLAEEQRDLAYYKQVLLEFQEAKIAEQEAKAARAKAKKDKSKKVEQPEPDEDVEMADADAQEAEESDDKKQKTKKRKAEDDTNTPQRSDSVKKPKIKLTNSATPKATSNGVESLNPTKDSSTKASKSKSKSSKVAKEADAEKPKKEAEKPKEPELTPEERHARKEKEILFLRHRLQKGLLNRESEPKEEEMKPMSEFLAKLETFPDLEVSIIRATKINKVLKAILKLAEIPKEAEYQFKTRSQNLLDKWNKILANDAPAAAAPAAPANGVNGTSKEAAGPKEGEEHANGVSGDAAAPKLAVEGDAPSTEPESKGVAVDEEKATAEVTTTSEPPAAEATV